MILDGYMVEILNYVDLLIHAGSTTALEAHFMNIPSLSFWNPAPERSPISGIAPRSSTFEELDRLISEVQPGQSNADPEVVAALEREFYGRIDGQACRRAAERIDELLRRSNSRPFRYPRDGYQADLPPGPDPYLQNITPREVTDYYAKVKACLDLDRRDMIDLLESEIPDRPGPAV